MEVLREGSKVLLWLKAEGDLDAETPDGSTKEARSH